LGVVNLAPCAQLVNSCGNAAEALIAKPCVHPKFLHPQPMRTVIQRVLESSVTIEGKIIAKIGPGLLILLGIEEGDATDDITWLCAKIAKMRIFPDAEGKMNLSVVDIKGDIIVVSQFTLHASTKKGNRPSFLRAANPSISEPLYENFCRTLETELAKPIGRGIFGADMKISLINDGPVTILVDSRAKE